jgi:hypothetical protein
MLHEVARCLKIDRRGGDIDIPNQVASSLVTVGSFAIVTTDAAPSASQYTTACLSCSMTRSLMTGCAHA